MTHPHLLARIFILNVNNGEFGLFLEKYLTLKELFRLPMRVEDIGFFVCICLYYFEQENFLQRKDIFNLSLVDIFQLGLV